MSGQRWCWSREDDWEDWEEWEEREEEEDQ